MTALTRRTLGKWFGSIATLLAVPFQRPATAAAAVGRPRSLRDIVQSKIDALSPETICDALAGIYTKVFWHTPSTMAIERMAHVAYLGVQPLPLLRDDQITRMDGLVRLVDERDGQHSNGYGQRWVFNAETREVAFWFSVVEDNDPRASDTPDIASNGILNRNVKVRPWRVSDLDKALAKLLAAHKEQREQDAAHVLRHANTYDTSIVGDGQPLLSASHPWEEGVWANTLAIHCDLSQTSFEAACDGIGKFVDERGQRIKVSPMQLVVGPECEKAPALAKAANLRLIVWGKLQPRAWFVQTGLDGLRYYERDPFEIGVWVDHETNEVLIKGYERRCFTYTEPRAVFGSIPPRTSQGI